MSCTVLYLFLFLISNNDIYSRTLSYAKINIRQREKTKGKEREERRKKKEEKKTNDTGASLVLH